MRLTVNGVTHQVEAAADTPLLWVLRDHLGLTGTKYGCGAAQCGACLVQLDGKPAMACATPLSAAEGRAITTIEGISGRVAQAVTAAWTELDVPQCGYCQSGQVMAAMTLLTDNPKPTDAQIDDALSGHLCRCATYQRIRAGIHAAARKLGA
ncbi:MAG: (2Fe-2S)-binding protein [Alphaproteobacteria bacterium]|nr:(2Fe-2S)-binding protein [Alphaproteobacteria bacterium]